MSKIDTLHPLIRAEVQTLVDKINSSVLKGNVKMVVTQGLRTFAEQDKLYAQRPKVTNAKGGQSIHNYGLAFDFCLADGGKMIWEGFGKENDKEKADQTRGWTLLILSIATSIDALAVGFSFSILKVPVIYPATVIGIVCFFMTVTGMLFGKVLAGIFGKKVEIFGGIVLIAIGIKILIDHGM